MITGMRSVGGSPVRTDGDVSADDEQAAVSTASDAMRAASRADRRRRYPDTAPS